MLPQLSMDRCPLTNEDCVFSSFCRGPPPSEPAMGYVPPSIVLHVDCTTVCQKYIQRYNAKYIQFKKIRIHQIIAIPLLVMVYQIMCLTFSTQFLI